MAASRTRIIRDSIHGDVIVDPIAAAVVDTSEFQRLRYIRQNGLLHFVFPGAVHTRFAHSVGTYWLATRAAQELFRPFRASPLSAHADWIDRYSTAFCLAALLHDVGHTAFSHSIEKVQYNGGPFLGTLEGVLSSWEMTELLERIAAAGTDRKEPISHEQLSLALMTTIFRQETVTAALSDRQWSADAMCRDVQAILHGKLPPSSDWDDSASGLAQACASAELVKFDAAKPGANLPRDLIAVLHSLISGTLDVDRLDYLNRDSIHCGVTYGHCAVDILISSLVLCMVDGHVELGLWDRAQHAVDDMLWSRFQLFVQVLNHKTNVALNAMLAQAMPEAVDDTRFNAPKTYDEFLNFTDDFVMSSVRSACRGNRLKNRVFAKALVYREVPQHLQRLRITPSNPIPSTSTVAATFGVDPAQVFEGSAESKIIKLDDGMFHIVSTSKADRRPRMVPYRPFDSLAGATPATSYHVVHYFVARDVTIAMAPEASPETLPTPKLTSSMQVQAAPKSTAKKAVPTTSKSPMAAGHEQVRPGRKPTSSAAPSTRSPSRR